MTGNSKRSSVFGLALFAMLFALCFSAEAQQPNKVYRIGFLDFRSRSTTTDPRLAAFRQGLRELGYVEGQNLVLEYRSAKGKDERLPQVAAELVRPKVDVIVTSGHRLVWHAAKRATRTIPIVMAAGAEDPVEAGVVKSLARPGGNITGLTAREVDVHGKRLELLKEAFPGISRVAIIWTSLQQKQGITEVKAAGQALGIQIQSVVVPESTRLGDLENAFSQSARSPLMPFYLDHRRSPYVIGHGLLASAPRDASLRSTVTKHLWMQVGSCRTGRTLLTRTGARPPM